MSADMHDSKIRQKKVGGVGPRENGEGSSNDVNQHHSYHADNLMSSIQSESGSELHSLEKRRTVVEMVPRMGKEEKKNFKNRNPRVEAIDLSWDYDYHQEDFVINPNVKKGFVHQGFCIQTDCRNKAFNPHHPGSLPKCAWLFSPECGIVRFFPEKNSLVDDVEVGNFYQFILKQNARRKEKRRRNKGTKKPLNAMDHYILMSAGKAEQLPTPREVEVVDGRIQIKCRFFFKRSIFEFEQNSKIADWEVRRNGLYTDAFFFDSKIGKVNMNKHYSEMILRKIEEHPSRFGDIHKFLLKEPISVKVTVELYRNCLTRVVNNSPAVFQVIGLENIRYVNYPVIIYHQK